MWYIHILLPVLLVGNSLVAMATIKDTKLDKVLRGSANEVLKQKHQDCDGWRQAGAKVSGVYIIYPNNTHPVKVHCEHGLNASYTVIQRRMYGNINFYTGWYYYKIGFGHSQGDYWAGLDNIHTLTTNGLNRLKIDMQDWNGNRRSISYSHFLVLDERSFYRLFVSGPSKSLPDDMSFNNGMNFATPDRPDPSNCAVNQRSGWWFNYCSYTLPNGMYYHGPYLPTTGFYDGVYYKDFMGYGYSLKFFSMSISK